MRFDKAWLAADWQLQCARMDASRAGGLAAVREVRVEGREIGVVWGVNAIPGPLDGQFLHCDSVEILGEL